MEILNITVSGKEIQGKVDLPASKSISNRALVIKFLSEDPIHLRNLSDSDDTEIMIRLLEMIRKNKYNEQPTTLFCENAGTVYRFLAALLAITPGNWILSGNERMMQRPVGPLVDALRKLGAQIDYQGEDGYPPIKITGTAMHGGEVRIDGSISSQFISALILIGPVLKGGLTIDIRNKIASMPYIQMTLKMLAHFDIESRFKNNVISIPEVPYSATGLDIEPDWSSASFWYELAALSQKADLFLSGLVQQSWQGDAVLSDIFNTLGVKTFFDNDGIRVNKKNNRADKFIFNFSNNPDLALPVITTCAGLNMQGVFSGLENLRFKESDRISALMTELSKFGFSLDLNQQNDIILHQLEKEKTENKPHDAQLLRVKTYGDHRMAMAFAPLGILFGGIAIENPMVVTKSYPRFWHEMKKIDVFQLRNLTS